MPKIGEKLLKGMSSLNPYISATMGLADGIGQIASMFTPSPYDNDKRVAAGTQQNLEKVAMDIEKRVASGAMRPEAAIIALNQLEAQAMKMGGMSGESGSNAPFGAGGSNASLIISQVKANIHSKLLNNYDAFAGSPFKAEDGSMHNLNDAGANEGLQKTRLRTGLRNYILGADQSLEGTPLTGAFKKSDPFANLPKAQEATDKYFKPVPLLPSALKRGIR